VLDPKSTGKIIDRLTDFITLFNSLADDPHMTLLIREEEVLRAVTPMQIIQAVEDGFRQHGLGLAQTHPRREVRIRNKDLPHADPRMVRIGQGLAFVEESGIALPNLIMSFPDRRTPGTRILNYVIDANDGVVIAVVESSALTGMHTAASGAVGVKYLARKDSSITGIIGTGRQGRYQLRFLSKVVRINKGYAYSLVPPETEKFCQEMGKELGIDLFPAKNSEEVVRSSDILVTATQSTSPIIRAEWLRQGQHFNIIGADDTPKIELEGAALTKADKLVISARDCFLAGKVDELPSIVSWAFN
jgi:ornithine cyclodeaminase/alanine dehydrogenase-like protein (mu-crystallin family)